MKSQLRVLHIVTGNYKSFFTEQIRILEDMGVDCDVAYAMDRSTKETMPEYNLFSNKFHNPVFYFTRGVKLSSRLMTKATQKYDVVHVNSGMVAPFGFIQPSRPIVITFWGDDLMGNRLYGQMSKMSKSAALMSSENIVRNKNMKKELKGDAHIIPAGVDTDKFDIIDKDKSLREVGWEKNNKYILFPYRPTKVKKQHPVAERVVELVNERTNENVVLKEVFDEPHERIPYYMNAADALLLPSKREGSPNTIKEAMACNLPIVVTDVGDVQERLDGISNSHIVQSEIEMTESLLDIIESGERSNARSHVHDVSLDAMGERIIEVYYEAISEN